MFIKTNTKPNFTLIPFLSVGFFIFFVVLGCQVDTPAKQLELAHDFDLDGVHDEADSDDDNDGIPDVLEKMVDLDGDGVPNHHDRDSDGDGIPDLIEATGVDKDGDAMLDPWDEWLDENRNGFHDEYENEPLVEMSMLGKQKIWQSHADFGLINLDQDKDGLPNFWDMDSDNDGISDATETGNKLQRSQIKDTNADGFDDRLVGHIYTQGDKISRSGHPEPGNENLSLYQTIYLDGSFGKPNGIPDIDDDGNGAPDFLESASR